MSLDRVFEALASAPRRKIIVFLSEGELSTSQLAERFEMTAPAISRHLSILESAGLVSGERRGQFVMYRLHGDRLLDDVTGYLSEVCPTTELMKGARRRRAA
jgi:DNA-binding transcriptional ArsR family regulator